MVSIKSLTKLAIAVTLASYTGYSWSCGSCSKVAQYGAELSSDIGSTTKDVVSTTGDIASGFASLVQQEMLSGDQIVGALQAMAATIDMQSKMEQQTRADLLNAMAESEETLAKSRMMAEINVEVAQTYGAQNIPSSSCRGFKNARVRNEARALAGSIMSEFSDDQKRRRINTESENSKKLLWQSPVNVSDGEFNVASAKAAIEKATLISGERSFGTSPDTILGLSETNPGSLTDEAISTYAAWQRSTLLSNDMAVQIAKRTKPEETTTEDGSASVPKNSLVGELEQEVAAGLSQTTIKEEINASSSTLLRSINRRMALGQKIKYEQLILINAMNRAKAVQAGYLAELLAKNISIVSDIEAIKSRVKD